MNTEALCRRAGSSVRRVDIGLEGSGFALGFLSGTIREGRWKDHVRTRSRAMTWQPMECE